MQEVEMKVELVAKTVPQGKLEGLTLEDFAAYAYTKSYQTKPNINVVKKFGLGKKHTSPLEFLNFVFDIENVSRPLLAQLTRHRIGWAFNVESQRYNNYEDADNYKYVVPKIIKENNLDHLFKHMMRAEQDLYSILIHEGVKPEDARFVLPPATAVNILAGVNLRALLHFWKLRGSYSPEGKHAQWEIRQLADITLDIVTEEIPELAKNIKEFLRE